MSPRADYSGEIHHRPQVAADRCRFVVGGGLAFTMRGDYPKAEAAARRCLALREQGQPANEVEIAIALTNLASVLQPAGKYTEAIALAARAIGIVEREFGEAHPMLVELLTARMFAEAGLGDYDAALRDANQAIARLTAIKDNSPLSVAAVYNNRSGILAEAGRQEEALPDLRRALGLVEAAIGPDHPQVASLLANLATVVNDLGDSAEAIRLITRALAIREATGAPDSLTLVQPLRDLGDAQRTAGKLAESARTLSRAVAIAEKQLPADSVKLVSPRLALAETEIALGHGDRADAQVEKSLVVLRGPNGNPEVRSSKRSRPARSWTRSRPACWMRPAPSRRALATRAWRFAPIVVHLGMITIAITNVEDVVEKQKGWFVANVVGAFVDLEARVEEIVIEKVHEALAREGIEAVIQRTS